MKVDMAQRGLIDDGTAIGMGIANALSRLKDSKAKSKVIILLTDGTNNCGQISPNTAADIAKSFGIRVYTIGVGTNGTARYPYPVGGHIEYVNVPVEIDTKTLAEIARKTDGEFYRATNNQKLHEVYQEIDKLEKTKMNVKQYSKRYEAYGMFMLISVLCLLLELLLQNTILKRIP
jgi:Ca-activated chloride channel family protein